MKRRDVFKGFSVDGRISLSAIDKVDQFFTNGFNYFSVDGTIRYDFQLSKEKKAGLIRKRKLLAVKKVFQCTHCSFKCEKCGTPMELQTKLGENEIWECPRCAGHNK